MWLVIITATLHSKYCNNNNNDCSCVVPNLPVQGMVPKLHARFAPKYTKGY